jgi:hypothetical protein
MSANEALSKFNRAQISISDFDEAEKYLREYKPNHSLTVRSALLFSAIISYVRPFTSNHPGPKNASTKSLDVDPQKILNKAEHKLHAKLIILRNNTLGHMSYKTKSTRLIFSDKRSFSVRQNHYELLEEEIDVEKFLGLCRKMRLVTQQMCHDLIEKHDFSSLQSAGPGLNPLLRPAKNRKEFLKNNYLSWGYSEEEISKLNLE